MPSTKSDQVKCIEQPGDLEPPSTYECKILDGAVIVHCLPTAGVVTFNDYADNVFIPYLEKLLQGTARLDIVWDTYIAGSLKECTRKKRGKGVRRKVSGQTQIPGNWMDFLRDTKNKKELFAFLTSKVAGIIWPPDKSVYITSGQYVESMNSSRPMLACNHEEADTRIVVHVMHALEQGMKSVLVRTVDTDVIVILVGVCAMLATIQPSADIWVAFGTGKNYTLYSIVHICASLGHHKSQALPVFHAFTGCDTTSSFRGKGKKSAWNAWQACDEVTETFMHLACNPFVVFNVDSHHFQMLERLAVLMYDKTSQHISVNEVRRESFCLKSPPMDRMPPTQDALLQHSQRAIYQAGIWTISMQAQAAIPSPQEFAWIKKSESWVSVWITLLEVSKACRELIKCTCKGECLRCKCIKSNLPCSPLCKCRCIYM